MATHMRQGQNTVSHVCSSRSNYPHLCSWNSL